MADHGTAAGLSTMTSMTHRLSDPEPARTRGRPADADIDARALDAAIEMFAETGWKGFNLDGVARRARVGKAALYRRWPTKEALIIAALEHVVLPDLDFDTGSLRGDLTTLGRHILVVNLSINGRAVERASLEARENPDVFGPRLRELVAEQARAGRRILQHAAERGEFAGQIPSWMVFATLAGTLQHRISTIGPEQQQRLNGAAGERLVAEVVDFVLAGLRGSTRE